jgi:hypothetical protein
MATDEKAGKANRAKQNGQIAEETRRFVASNEVS